MTEVRTTQPVAEFEQLAPYRAELTRHAYRMLGSSFEAEDAVQETMVRAWKNLDKFEGRSALRSWLYRITTNVCLDMLGSSQRRARPMDVAPMSTVSGAKLNRHPENTWLEPIPDGRALSSDDDPADLAESRESIRLAFIAALQNLPPKQRAVLILRDVLRWKAAEVAELLDLTVVSVNSALQRARATLADGALNETDETKPVTPDQEALLASYVDAFERYDINSLVALLHEDATLSMPPYDLWLRGRDEAAAWHLGPGAECQGSRMIPIKVNGSTGFAQYRVDPAGGFFAWGLHVLETLNGQIVNITYFLNTELFAQHGLPLHLDE